MSLLVFVSVHYGGNRIGLFRPLKIRVEKTSGVVGPKEDLISQKGEGPEPPRFLLDIIKREPRDDSGGSLSSEMVFTCFPFGMLPYDI